MVPRRLAILGCGWLGLGLARLARGEGMSIRGSTRTDERLGDLHAEGIEAVRLRLPGDAPSPQLEKFLQADALVISLPPGRRDPEVEQRFPALVAGLAAEVALSSVSNVIFWSSTSVYASRDAEVDESDDSSPDTPSGRALRAAERLLHEALGDRLTVLRLGGLLGDDRHPARKLAGQTKLGNGDAPVNLVGRQDAARASLACLLDPAAAGETFNVVAPVHPTRKDFYTAAADRLGLPAPPFDASEASPWKRVRAEKIQRRLGWSFLHPDPRDIPIDGS